MKSETIYYFEKESNVNFKEVANIVKEYVANHSNVKNITIFAANMESVVLLHDILSEQDVTITVATYGYGREFTIPSDNDQDKTIIPEVTTKESKSKIIDLGMNYVQGGLPFEPIRSCTGDNAIEMIVSTLGMISKGLVHCVSAAIMAKENGYLEDDEKIIALSGDTAVVITPCLRRDLFSNKFRIHEILCKPY